MLKGLVVVVELVELELSVVADCGGELISPLKSRGELSAALPAL